jgi:hypothetical protein
LHHRATRVSSWVVQVVVLEFAPSCFHYVVFEFGGHEEGNRDVDDGFFNVFAALRPPHL